MVSRFNAVPTSTPIQLDPLQVAHTLAELLSLTPEYRAYLDALNALKNDQVMQRLSSEMRSHQIALKWGYDPDSQHVSELTRLELEIEDHPVMKAYHQAEEAVSVMFRAVDEILSSEMGVAFAVNAQHGSCSCGG